MASQPPISPDTIEPQSPDEAPASPGPIEEPVPSEPDATPDGGDIDEPGRGPEEYPADEQRPVEDNPDSLPANHQQMGFDVQQRADDGSDGSAQGRQSMEGGPLDK